MTVHRTLEAVARAIAKMQDFGSEEKWREFLPEARAALRALANVADRTAGQAYTDLAAEAVKRAVLAEAEVERLRSANADGRLGVRRLRDRAERAEAKLDEVRALLDDDPHAANWGDLRAVLDREVDQ